LVAWLVQSKQVDTEDIRRVYSLFVDVKRSVQYLSENEEHFLYSEAAAQQASDKHVPMVAE
jgi:RuvB-like protein 2